MLILKHLLELHTGTSEHFPLKFWGSRYVRTYVVRMSMYVYPYYVCMSMHIHDTIIIYVHMYVRT